MDYMETGASWRLFLIAGVWLLVSSLPLVVLKEWLLVAAAVVTSAWFLQEAHRLRRRWKERSSAGWSPTVPAGWYVDPEQPEQVRYWNGAMWTNDVGERARDR